MAIFENISTRFSSILLVAAAFALVGCAPLDSTSSGKIAGSIGLRMSTTDSHFKGVFLGFRSVDKKVRGVIGYFPDLIGGAFAEIKEGEFHGSTFLKTLPAGEYEFLWRSPKVNFLGVPAEEVPISHFLVKPGQVTYVGSWEATPVTRGRLLGPDRMIGYRFITRNREARDMALINRKTSDAPLTNNSQARKGAALPARPETPVRTESGTEYLNL